MVLESWWQRIRGTYDLSKEMRKRRDY